MSMLRKDILDCDLTKFPAVVYLALLFFISRVPFIALGFSAFTSSTDQDVLAVVNSAYLLRYEHIYTVSRFPGYPFFEIFNSLLIGGGWVFTNIATAMMSFISVILFGKILNIFEIKNRALLLLTFAFIPVIWINSTITMDYMWALMFILLGSYLVFSGRYSMAGVAIGFAIGTRFTSAFMFIPLILWALSEKVSKRKILTFGSTALSTALILFLPVIYKYGVEFLQGSGFLYTTPVRKSISVAASSTAIALNNMIMELFGIAALVMLIFFVALTLKRKQFHDSENRHLLKFCWLTLLIFILLYFIFPYKVAYLIPIVPWGLIILNEKLNKTFTIIICILLLLNSVVAVEFISDASSSVRVDSGIVIKNYEDRISSSIEQSKEYMESLSKVLQKG